MTFTDTIKKFLWYKTVKVVQIRNWKLGALHFGIELIIILYIILYVLFWSRGYNGTSPVEGFTYTKLKGSALEVNEDDSYRVWDATDIVIPPTEANAIFITTNSLITPGQSRGEYVDSSLSCNSNENCVKGKSEEHGINVGTCANVTGTDDGGCLIYGWGPIEDDVSPTNKTVLQDVKDFSLFIRSSVVFSKYNKLRDNLAGSDLTPGLNQFFVGEILGNASVTWDECSVSGCIVGMTINWDCAFNFWSPKCKPDFNYFRIDNPSDNFSKGFNFRYANYYYLPTNETYNPESPLDNAVQYRDLFKVYGVRLIFLVSGVGYRFSVIPLMANIASGLALLTIATLLSDVLALYILPHHQEYLDAKIEPVNVVIEDGVEKYDIINHHHHDTYKSLD